MVEGSQGHPHDILGAVGLVNDKSENNLARCTIKCLMTGSILTCRLPFALSRNSSTLLTSSSSLNSRRKTSLESSYKQPDVQLLLSDFSPRCTSSRSPLSSAYRMVMVWSSFTRRRYGSAKLAWTTLDSVSLSSSARGNIWARPKSGSN